MSLTRPMPRYALSASYLAARMACGCNRVGAKQSQAAVCGRQVNALLCSLGHRWGLT